MNVRNLSLPVLEIIEKTYLLTKKLRLIILESSVKSSNFDVMLSYEVFAEIFVSLKKYLDEKFEPTSIVVCSQNYITGRQEYCVFECSQDEYKFDESLLLEKLNELREAYSFELFGWDKFSVESGYFDHDLTRYCFSSEFETEKKPFEQFNSIQ